MAVEVVVETKMIQELIRHLEVQVVVEMALWTRGPNNMDTNLTGIA